MSAVINAVAQLFNDLLASLGTIGNDILHVGTALVYTVVHFVSTALSKTLSFAYENTSLLILAAVAFVGYQMYTNPEVRKRGRRAIGDKRKSR